MIMTLYDISILLDFKIVYESYNYTKYEYKDVYISYEVYGSGIIYTFSLKGTNAAMNISLDHIISYFKAEIREKKLNNILQ